MAINFFDDSESQLVSHVDLPFVKDYVIGLGDSFEPVCSIVRSAKNTQKGTGVLLFTNDYKLMLFNGSKPIQWLTETLIQWVAKPQTGHVIISQTLDRYPYYRLGIDDSVRALWLSEGNGWSCIPDTTGQSDTTLPLIPTAPVEHAKTTRRNPSKD
jgi:hypothetical protein